MSVQNKAQKPAKGYNLLSQSTEYLPWEVAP